MSEFQICARHTPSTVQNQGTYRGRFLLRLLRGDINVPVVSPYGHWWRRLGCYVCEDAVVVRATASWTSTAGHALVVRLREKCTKCPAENRLG
jgi:hypothetical protein